ncbi:MAG: SIMPL domain-containing protein [Planctomycetota bacterium]|nr:MAG: SIMPL domain-containing protein [Planctomycetota bacterium]
MDRTCVAPSKAFLDSLGLEHAPTIQKDDPMHRLMSAAIILANAAMLVTNGFAAETQRTISVTGEGRATAPPDMATIRTGVVTQSAKASEALTSNNEAMDEIMSVLEEQGIAPKNIQTSNFNVSPQYKHDDQGRRQPEIVGYRVTNQLRVDVHDLPKLGKILDALVVAGSNELTGISFGINDPTGLLNEARKRAVADAHSRAELYAQAAGVALGKVLTISEQTVRTPQPQRLAARKAANASVPIATGEQELRATVDMVFALEVRESASVKEIPSSQATRSNSRSTSSRLQSSVPGVMTAAAPAATP